MIKKECPFFGMNRKKLSIADSCCKNVLLYAGHFSFSKKNLLCWQLNPENSVIYYIQQENTTV